MITVRYSPYKLTVQGHAGSAPYGHDLICASIAAITYTAMAAVSEDEDTVNALDPVIYETAGDVRIECNPTDEDKCRELFRVLCAGYEAYAEQFPQYVQFFREET